MADSNSSAGNVREFPGGGTPPTRDDGELVQLRNELSDCDCLAQGAAGAIRAMARGAQRLLLDGTPDSLLMVRALLQEMEVRAMMLSNDINCAAERCGVNFVDGEGRAASEALYRARSDTEGVPDA